MKWRLLGADAFAAGLVKELLGLTASDCLPAAFSF